MPSWWDPIDVSTWREHAFEQRGKRPKTWIVNPTDGRLWLRKAPPERDPANPHTARMSEPALELLALELARRAGLPCAEARPALWSEHRGIISRSFQAADEQQYTGAELLGLPSDSGSGPEARERRDEGRAVATLDNVERLLRAFTAATGFDVVLPFARILAFDAWIGNGDRHSGNWAILVSTGSARLAPMYDPAACLGVELTDGRAELANPDEGTVARYAARCGSGFGGGRDHVRGRWVTGIRMSAVIDAAASWPEWVAAISELRPRFLAITDEAEALLADIPSDWLSEPRKLFASRLLAHRVRIL